MSFESIELKSLGGNEDLNNGVNLTGSCHYIKFNGQKETIQILIDAGNLQGCPLANALNDDLSDIDVKSLDAILITHAHMDHIGKLPYIVKKGFRGKILMHPATFEIAKFMWEDQLNIASIEKSQLVHKKTLLYKAISQLKKCLSNKANNQISQNQINNYIQLLLENGVPLEDNLLNLKSENLTINKPAKPEIIEDKKQPVTTQSNPDIKIDINKQENFVNNYLKKWQLELEYEVVTGFESSYKSDLQALEDEQFLNVVSKIFLDYPVKESREYNEIFSNISLFVNYMEIVFNKVDDHGMVVNTNLDSLGDIFEQLGNLQSQYKKIDEKIILSDYEMTNEVFEDCKGVLNKLKQFFTGKGIIKDFEYFVLYFLNNISKISMINDLKDYVICNHYLQTKPIGVSDKEYLMFLQALEFLNKSKGSKKPPVTKPQTDSFKISVLQKQAINDACKSSCLYDEKDYFVTLQLISKTNREFKNQLKNPDFDNNQVDFQLFDNLNVSMLPAGHIIGSTQIMLSAPTTKGEFNALFSGDIGRFDGSKLVPPIITTAKPLNYLQIESTYAGRNHKNSWDNAGIDLLKEINESDKLTLVAAFSMQRFQEILYFLELYFDQLNFDNIICDSRLALNVSILFRNRYPKLFQYLNNNIFTWIHDVNDRSMFLADIIYGGKKALIVSSSGMLQGGPILGHYLAPVLENPEGKLILTGYQADLTNGGKLGKWKSSNNSITSVDGKVITEIFNDGISDKKVCYLEGNRSKKIVQIDGFSGHAGQSDLLKYVTSHTLKSNGVIGLTHGGEDRILLGNLISELGTEYNNIHILKNNEPINLL